MAHTPLAREPAPISLAWRCGAILRRALAHLPTACGLCEGSSAGGRLCLYCAAALRQSTDSAVARCATCFLALKVPGPCPDCVRQAPAFDRVVAAFDYQAPGDILIHHLKVGRRFSCAAMLADLLAEAVTQATPPLPADAILVPVPASRASIIMRGFNPAAEIAYALAARLQMECQPRLLLRVREGLKQTQLTRSERVAGVQSLYHCPYSVQGANIAVVDDVLTTGSTLHSIAVLFKSAGAASVSGLVLARTPCQ